MNIRRAAARAAVLAALALSACFSGGQGERYQTMRDALARAEARSRAEASDSLDGTSELSREGLVTSVLERNPSLDAARAAARAALARWPQETALPDPRFGYLARPRSFSSDEVDPANDFMLEQSLPFPGKLGLRGERALAEAEAAQDEVTA